MNRIRTVIISIILVAISYPAIVSYAEESASDFYSLSANLLNGENKSFGEYRGSVILIANIALQCGTTPQLKALQDLENEFGSQGLIILGFPSGDFTGENLDDKAAIHNFCTKNYSITFPIFSPGSVTGKNPQPVFAFLTHFAPPEAQGPIEFNFEKFLVDRKGIVRSRFGSFTSAQSQSFRKALTSLLAEER